MNVTQWKTHMTYIVYAVVQHTVCSYWLSESVSKGTDLVQLVNLKLLENRPSHLARLKRKWFIQLISMCHCSHLI